MNFDLNPRKDSKTDFMYFEDEPGREDYPGDYTPEDNIEEKSVEIEETPEEKIQVEDSQEAEDETEDKIEVSDEPEMREVPEATEIDFEATEDNPEVMIRSPVLASKTESEPSGKSTSRFFAEIGDFDEIKIGKLDGNSGNLTTFL